MNAMTDGLSYSTIYYLQVRGVNASSSTQADKGCRVAAQYMQLKKFFALGTPTVFVVDRNGTIRYAHYATSLAEEPDSAEPLALLTQLAA